MEEFMKAEIKKNRNKHFSIDVKRFYLPFEINWECPNCKTSFSEDLNHHYLSYPDAGIPFVYDLYCTECEHEDEIEIQLDIDLKIVK